MQVVVGISIAAKQKDAFFKRNEHLREMTCKFFSVLANQSPIKRRQFVFLRSKFKALLFLLTLLFDVQCEYVERHARDPSTAKFKPVRYVGEVDEQAVLLGITPKQFSLCYQIVYHVGLLFLVFKVCLLCAGVRRVGQSRRQPNKIFVALCIFENSFAL